MQFFTTLTTVALALIGAASAMPSYSSSAQCSSGSMHCCNDVQPASSDPISALLKSLEIRDIDSSSSVGVSCTPINTGSVGGNPSCTQMPVCCDGNQFSGITLGCSPIALLL
ncbi:hypothetical protein BN946_scf184998.g53 [Trametes cinnabarina]|uniref:Hydrophobin n=1 Tax=Pycnoporus cinnabarinus TaxID=5643 RepID=A0A060S2Z0_PYCCI|nr:hypothetical protein BN946_scf184998.g53 [Trametes cinnabarina]